MHIEVELALEVVGTEFAEAVIEGVSDLCLRVLKQVDVCGCVATY